MTKNLQLPGLGKRHALATVYHFHTGRQTSLLPPREAPGTSALAPTLTRLLVCDFVETILKHFVEMVMFIITSSHFDISLLTPRSFLV